MIDQKNKKRLNLAQIDCNTHKYILNGDPTFITTTKDGIGKIHDRTKRNKLIDTITVRSQHDDRPLSRGPLKLSLFLYFNLPSRPGTKKGNVISGDYQILSPDIAGCIKYIEEISKGILFNETSNISVVEAYKLYDDNPRAEFYIVELT